MYRICHITLCLLGACLLALPLGAQEDNRKPFSPQDFVKELESFIVREACLTPSEATAFFPIFHELHDKQRAINWQLRELKKRSLPADATDMDYYELIREINNLKIESAGLEDSYYKKMCRAIPAQKVHDAMKAEDKFHRRMLRRFSDRPPRKNNGTPETETPSQQ